MDIDIDIASLGESQHGLVTYSQALAIGASHDDVQRRVRHGRWGATQYRGVYRIAGSPRSWEQALLALVLAAGPGAAASHRSAAALLHVPGFRRGAPEVTTPRRWRQRADRAMVHSSRILPPEHVTRVAGIPATAPARLIVDLAGVLRPGQVARALDNCLAQGIVTLAAIGETTAALAKRGRRGIAEMRRLLDERSPGYVPPASGLEAQFLATIERAGLPQPSRQVDVGGDDWVGRVDFVYLEQRILIEIDGRRHHTALLDLEADRVRDNRLAAAGWRVIRITWEQLVKHPDRVVALIRQLLAGAA